MMSEADCLFGCVVVRTSPPLWIMGPCGMGVQVHGDVTHNTTPWTTTFLATQASLLTPDDVTGPRAARHDPKLKPNTVTRETIPSHVPVYLRGWLPHANTRPRVKKHGYETSLPYARPTKCVLENVKQTLEKPLFSLDLATAFLFLFVSIVMDNLFGFKGDGYAMLAADTNAARSILVFKQDEQKIAPLSKKMIMATSGAQGDRVHFSEYIQKNIVLNELRNGFPMSCVATANFVRNEISSNLRRRPHNVNCLLGGFEKDKGSCLYFVDYFGTMHKMNFGCHGHCAAFCLSLFDRHWEVRLTGASCAGVIPTCFDQNQISAVPLLMLLLLQPDLSLEQGIELMRKCFTELKV